MRALCETFDATQKTVTAKFWSWLSDRVLSTIEVVPFSLGCGRLVVWGYNTV